MKKAAFLIFIFLLMWPISRLNKKPDKEDFTIRDIEMVFVKGGTFKMGRSYGNSDEKPVHTVTLEDFYIGKYEVTNAQFVKFLNEYKSEIVKSGPDSGKRMIYSESWGINHKKDSRYDFRDNLVVDESWEVNEGCGQNPVVGVSWYGANEFCNWINARLPTEAEWEFAARGGNQTQNYKYSGSDQLDSVAWYKENSEKYIKAVGLKKANELGIYDMNGNISEWCFDWYDARYYRKSPELNPMNDEMPSKIPQRVLRGGAFYTNRWSTNPFDRDKSPPENVNRKGFRICLSKNH